MPFRLALRPLTQMCPSGSPSIRSVPGPVYFSAEYRLRVQVFAARREIRRGAFPTPRADPARRAGTCARWRPTVARPLRSSGRRERSSRPMPALAAATTAQFVSLRETCSRNGRTSRAVACRTALDQLRRLALEQIGIVRADRQHGMARGDVLGERLGQPRRIIAERIARRVLEPQRLLRLVAVDRLDERRSGAIRCGRDFTRERRRFERRAAVGQRPDNHQPLSRLQVQRNLARQARHKFP